MERLAVDIVEVLAADYIAPELAVELGYSLVAVVAAVLVIAAAVALALGCPAFRLK